MRDAWNVDQVAALAPDSPSLGAARGLATPGKWEARGAGDGPPGTLWGLAKGSGSKPYQTCVDLDEPAYRCSCPSRKFPCKHALGLLLMWAAGSIEESESPDWVLEWHANRAGRAAKAQARKESTEPPTEAQVKAATKRATQRDDRVASGVTELAQWLDDQVRNGLAGLDRSGYQHWDTAAARLIDAQAPGLARRVRGLAGIVSSREGWEQRLLAELGELRLLTKAFERLGELPPALAETVRGHVGYTVPVEQVLASPPVRDRWQVIGVRDDVEERLTTRRTWLVGRDTGRAALVLAFAVPGQALAADLVVGTVTDADLCFYPGALPLRAVVSSRHSAPERGADPAPAVGVKPALSQQADAIAADPWLEAWPMLVRGVLVPSAAWHAGMSAQPEAAGRAGTSWYLVDDDGDALPVRTRSGEPWHIVAAAGGHPAAIAGEWSPEGFGVLAAYVDDEVIGA
jgi:SWIM zinc finger